MTKEITISQFKAHCLEIIAKLQNDDEPVIITKRQKPVAKIEAINSDSKISIFGMLKDQAEIRDDIIEPVSENWSVNDE